MTTDDDPAIRSLNDAPVDEAGDYVLYWMQSSQRADDNAALHTAILRANELGKPVVALFALMDDYPEASERHFAFMLEGLAETSDRLADLGVRLVGRRAFPPEAALALARRAALVVTDAAYLRHLRDWRERLAADCAVRVLQVESDVVVPVGLASDKAEYAARTIRPKIERHLEARANPVPRLRARHRADRLELSSEIDFDDPDGVLDSMSVDREVARVSRFRGGLSEARRRLAGFLRHHLDGYAERRADPARTDTSELSPYLHFGQIGVVEIVAKVQGAGSGDAADRKAYLEELVVRRELARNYTWFTPDYDAYAALPDWARETLAEHRDDARPARYTRGELERAETDDPYWNAAMEEMRRTGYMHNAMRMYWGKKVLEWCNTPEYAFRTLLYLNNRWFLDGRDPSSYANVAWVFGLHDRPWQERDVFGKVRYMNAAGLERKFDIEAYVERVGKL